MGGAFVFPGGKMEEGDCRDEAGLRASVLSPGQARRRLQEPALPQDTALGLFLTAIRETFEEAGVLLARDAAGQLLRFREGETAGRFAGYRLQLYEQKLSLGDLARRERLRYATDLLVPYSHWITPYVEVRRFDTRFFLCRHPRGQAPFHENIEMTRSLWIPPSEALERYAQGRILLVPPTLKTLEELAAFPTAAKLFAHARRARIHPILPEAYRFPGGFGLKLPHDPAYSLKDFKQPPRLEEPSRIVMQDDRWQTLRFEEGGNDA